jgi:hypothetical protein
MAILIDQHKGRWAASLTSDGPDGLVELVVQRLIAFRLARAVEGGIAPLPAIGRFRSTELSVVAALREQLALDGRENT